MSEKFPGFSPKAITFFRQLEKNNDRNWFAGRKTVYEEHCREPMIRLAGLLCDDLRSFAADHVVEPKRAVYRIYRDTRFSKDKTPYKTHVAAMFPAKGLPKHAGAGFYVQVSHQGVVIAGGMYMPGPAEQAAIRRAIANDPAGWKKLVESKPMLKKTGPLLGDRYVRMPKDLDPAHPAGDYLRMKQWYFDVSLPVSTATAAGVHKAIADRFRAMAPVIHWLNAAARAAVEENDDEPASAIPKRPAPCFDVL